VTDGVVNVCFRWEGGLSRWVPRMAHPITSTENEEREMRGVCVFCWLFPSDSMKEKTFISSVLYIYTYTRFWRSGGDPIPSHAMVGGEGEKKFKSPDMMIMMMMMMMMIIIIILDNGGREALDL
jgi:hypothetical protein